MTRYYAPTCFVDTPEGKEKGVEGWHESLRRALWCHAILNPTVHPLDVICAKDPGEKKKRQLNEEERKEIIRIISTCPWDLKEEEVREVIERCREYGKKPPWELGVCCGSQERAG